MSNFDDPLEEEKQADNIFNANFYDEEKPYDQFLYFDSRKRSKYPMPNEENKKSSVFIDGSIYTESQRERIKELLPDADFYDEPKPKKRVLIDGSIYTESQR